MRKTLRANQRLTAAQVTLSFWHGLYVNKS
jgi:hypothetical protein